MGNRPVFNISAAKGTQGELWVLDLLKTLKTRSSDIEVKRDAWFPVSGRIYVEMECKFARGWAPSGIQTTKSRLWVFVFGPHPGCLVLATDWLRRACVEALKDPRNEAKGNRRGKNPTRGAYVYMPHVLRSRDASVDERSWDQMWRRPYTGPLG